MANRLNVQNIYASDSQSTPSVTIDASGISAGTIGSGVVLQGFVGMIAAFAMSTAPSGWLACQGGEVLITDYQDLYNVISTTWNTKIDPTTGSAHSAPSAGHFRLPDFRGSFLRGVGTASGKDAVTFAGYQTEKTQMPTAAFSTNTAGYHSHTHYASVNGSGYNMPLFENRALNQGGFTTAGAGSHSHIISGGDNETRPLNFGVYYWIKY